MLEQLLNRYCPDVKVVAKCASVLEALEIIKKQKPQVVFLDIEMPNYAGFEILNFFDKVTFEIIFVTAYNDYAIKAFEVSAVDYLLKPVDIDRLKEAVFKVKGKLQVQHQSKSFEVLQKTLEENEVNSIIVKEKGYHKAIQCSAIIALEAQESYTNIHTKNKVYLVSKNLKHFESIFSGDGRFFRCHKSWIIQLSHVVKYQKTQSEILMDMGIVVKLSKYRKEAFESELTNQSK